MAGGIQAATSGTGRWNFRRGRQPLDQVEEAGGPVRQKLKTRPEAGLIGRFLSLKICDSWPSVARKLRPGAMFVETCKNFLGLRPGAIFVETCRDFLRQKLSCVLAFAAERKF
jgi:hypothetical protein